MKNKIFKLLSVVMTLAMVFTMFACVAHAEETTVQENSLEFVPEWTQGTIDKGVEMPNVDTRFHSVDYIQLADVKKINIASGWKMGMHFYTDSGEWVTNASWFTGEVTIDTILEKAGVATKMKILVATNNNDSLTLEAIAADAIVVTKYNTAICPELTVGTIDKGVVMPNVDTRFHTVENYALDKIAKITIAKGWKIGFHFYDADGNWLGNYSWVQASNDNVEFTAAEINEKATNGSATFKILLSTLNNDSLTAEAIPADALVLSEGYVNIIPEEPDEPETPDEPTVPDNGVKVVPVTTQGTIDKNAGEIMSAVTTRVYTKDVIYISDIQNFYIGSNHKYTYHVYDANGNWLAGSIGSWQYSKKSGAEIAAAAEGATYVRFVIAARNDAEIYPEAINESVCYISLVEGLNGLTKPGLEEAEPELPPLAEDPELKINIADYVYDRGNGLANTFAKLNNGEEINVLYMGGSVTNGTGASDRELTSWRGIISNWLAHNAGNGKVNNINAAYGDSCTLFGAYRLNAEILPEQPDLIFVEFSINDMYNSGKRGYDLKDSTAQFETIIRNLRKALPDCDIVTVLITESGTRNPDTLQAYAQAHEDICIAYNIPSIHVGRALAKEMVLTDTQWGMYSGDSVHPNDVGYSIYAAVIKSYMAAELAANGDSTVVTKHTLPAMVSEQLVDGDIGYIDADTDLIAASEALGGTGFAYGSGATNLGNSGTDIFKGGVYSKNEADELVVKFTGTELSIIEYQPVKGISVSVDGGEYVTISRDSVRPLILVSDLEYGEHIVRIKPVFSAASSTFHVIGFFTRNQNAVTTNTECKHTNYVDGFCTECGIYEVLEPTVVKVDGVWNYYVNGYRAADTTLVKYSGKWYYVEDGVINWTAKTVVKYNNKWYYVKSGKWNKSTTLCKYNDTWYYIKNGKIDFKATTLVKYKDTWYYVKNGKKNTSTTLVKYKGTWYYVKSGKKSTATTLCKYGSKYYYVKKGKKSTATAIVKYKGKKYYVKKGIAQTKFSGKVKINGKKYTVKKGIVK